MHVRAHAHTRTRRHADAHSTRMHAHTHTIHALAKRQLELLQGMQVFKECFGAGSVCSWSSSICANEDSLIEDVCLVMKEQDVLPLTDPMPPGSMSVSPNVCAKSTAQCLCNSHGRW